jgi:predicted GTPase
VIGNKSDNKKVGDADKAAKSKGCQYIEISAKTGQYVNEMVDQVTGEFR